MYHLEKTARNHKNTREKQNPSFSSTLLDQIYDSIDESETKINDSKKQIDFGIEINRSRFLVKRVDHDALFLSSRSNSSDSSSGPVSSSDNESMKTTSSCFARPRLVKTVSERKRNALFREQSEFRFSDDSEKNGETQKLSFESFVKPKSKSFHISKNLKQPVSPGSRIVSFLNFVFSARNRKKSTTPSLAGSSRLSKSAQPLTCTPSSSFSRTCRNEHSPAAGESFCNVVQRTIRLNPVNEDVRFCVRKIQNDVVGDSVIFKARATKQNDDCDEQNDSDCESCTSSDLFELDHLKMMECDRYREELPVYENTSLDRNRPIVNGLTL